MRSLLRYSSLGVLAVLLTSTTFAQAPDATKPVRVFTAGHSFHLPSVAPLIEITKGAGVNHKLVGKQMIGGSSVTQHWQKDDATNDAKKALKAGEVDVLTLSPNILVPDPAIDKFTDLLVENNPNGRVCVQMSWLPYDGNVANKMKWTNAMRDETDLAELRKVAATWTDNLRKQVKSINDAHREKSKRDVACAVPCGEALYLLRDRIKVKEVPGIATQASLFRDELGHGGPVMAVLSSYCHYAVIYGKSPVGLPVPAALKAANLGDNTEKVNRILQECAWNAVQDEPSSGVKK